MKVSKISRRPYASDSDHKRPYITIKMNLTTINQMFGNWPLMVFA